MSGEGTMYNENPKLLEEAIDYKNLNYIGDFWTKYDGNF